MVPRMRDGCEYSGHKDDRCSGFTQDTRILNRSSETNLSHLDCYQLQQAIFHADLQCNFLILNTFEKKFEILIVL